MRNYQPHNRRPKNPQWRRDNNKVAPTTHTIGGNVTTFVRPEDDPVEAAFGANPPPVPHDDAIGRRAGNENPEPDKGDSQTEVLLKLALAAELFHTDDHTAFADIMVDGHRETHRISRPAFRSWLTHLYYQQEERAPNSTALDTALATITAKARFDGEMRAVHVRTGEHGGKIYIDLCNDAWQAIEIDADGWREVSAPGLRFIRSAGMLPLPKPVKGGSIEELRQFINVKRPEKRDDSDSDFILVVAFTLAALLPSGPYAILVLTGREGSAKSTLMKILRELIDPNRAPIRALPREEADLFISASNGHMLAYDNVSRLPDWLSDACCRIATGGAYAKRQLYKDAEEVLLDACQPISLNGIQDFVANPDLADRSVFLLLEHLETYTPEKAFWEAFEAARPRILGALFDAMSVGIARLPHIQLAWTPRLADFAKWGSACETAIWKKGTFMMAYAENRGEAAQTVIDGHTLASTLFKFLEGRPTWTGTATELLKALDLIATEQERKERGWPKRPNALSNSLRVVAGVLGKVGYRIEFDREGHRRQIKINLVGKGSSSSSHRHNHLETNGSDMTMAMTIPEEVTMADPHVTMGYDDPPSSNPLQTNGNDDHDANDDLLPGEFLDDGDDDPYGRKDTDFQPYRKL